MPSASRRTDTEPVVSCSWEMNDPVASVTGSAADPPPASLGAVGTASTTTESTKIFQGWKAAIATPNPARRTSARGTATTGRRSQASLPGRRRGVGR